MIFSAKTRYLLVTLAVLTACVIQLVRGYRPLIVAVGAIVFLGVGNLTVYLSGARQRAIRRQQRRDYFAGNS